MSIYWDKGCERRIRRPLRRRPTGPAVTGREETGGHEVSPDSAPNPPAVGHG